MGRFESLGILWPPAGWPQLAAVKQSTAQSIAKHISSGRVFGLQYRVESMPLFKMETKLFRHDLHIEGWEYSIHNESTEYPVLSLSVFDRFDLGLAKECFITDIRSYDTAMPHTARSANRALSAALFMIRQIESGFVPDINRILRSYKLHPAQAFLYRPDKRMAHDLMTAFLSTDFKGSRQDSA